MFKLFARKRLMVTFKPRLHYPLERKLLPIEQKALWAPESGLGGFGKETNLLPLPGYESRTKQSVT
jgi:hypothetical protein